MRFHFQPPKMRDYKSEEEFLVALEEWERREDEYWDNLVEERNN